MLIPSIPALRSLIRCRSYVVARVLIWRGHKYFAPTELGIGHGIVRTRTWPANGQESSEVAVRHLVDVVAKEAEIKPGDHVIDIGCG